MLAPRAYGKNPSLGAGDLLRVFGKMTNWRRILAGGWLAGVLAACGASERAPTASDPCHVHLRPGADDALALQSALLGAAPGSVICLDAGTYRMADGLSVGVPGLTIRGTGEGAILDFSSQRGRAPGLEIAGDDVTVERLELRDARGAAVRVMGADNVRIASVRMSWTRPDDELDDGVALYGASNTLLRDVEARGASGFGIRVVDAVRTVIDGASLAENAAGIWIEGGADVEVTGTEIRGNRAGIVLSTNAAGEGERAKIHGNLIEGAQGGEGKEGFAGLGLAVVGPFSAEIHDNLIRANDGAGLFALRGDGDADRFFLTVHGNRFVGNGSGTAPDRDLLIDAEVRGAVCVRANEGVTTETEFETSCPGTTLPPLSL